MEFNAKAALIMSSRAVKTDDSRKLMDNIIDKIIKGANKGQIKISVDTKDFDNYCKYGLIYLGFKVIEKENRVIVRWA